MAIKCPDSGMEISMEAAILGRMPMITNSVSPIPNPPMARESKAFLFVGRGVYNANRFLIVPNQAPKVVGWKRISYMKICQYLSDFHIHSRVPWSRGRFPVQNARYCDSF